MFPPDQPLMICSVNLAELPRETLGIYIPAVRRIALSYGRAQTQTSATMQVLLDAYAFTLLLANALARPRSSSQKLLELLYRDGAVFFVVSDFFSTTWIAG